MAPRDEPGDNGQRAARLPKIEEGAPMFWEWVQSKLQF